MEFKPPSFETM